MIKELKQIQEIARDAEAKLQRITSGNVGHTANTVRQQLILITQLVERATETIMYDITDIPSALAAVSHFTGVSTNEICRGNSEYHVVSARWLFVLASVAYGQNITPLIAAQTVGRDRTMYYHAKKQLENSYDFEKQYNQFIKKIAS